MEVATSDDGYGLLPINVLPKNEEGWNPAGHSCPIEFDIIQKKLRIIEEKFSKNQQFVNNAKLRQSASGWTQSVDDLLKNNCNNKNETEIIKKISRKKKKINKSRKKQRCEVHDELINLRSTLSSAAGCSLSNLEKLSCGIDVF